jgi:hypothetical protein
MKVKITELDVRINTYQNLLIKKIPHISVGFFLPHV